MTKARIQPSCRANNNNFGYLDATRVIPRLVTGRNKALYLHNRYFCSTWQSENVSKINAIEELTDNFKIVDNYITGEKVKPHFEYI